MRGLPWELWRDDRPRTFRTSPHRPPPPTEAARFPGYGMDALATARRSRGRADLQMEAGTEGRQEPLKCRGDFWGEG